MFDDSPYAVLDDEFWAPLDQKVLTPEFRQVVERELPGEAWAIRPQGLWTGVQPRGWVHAAQGWKLHVSATPLNAAEVLGRVAGVLKDDPAAFKFASDPTLLGIILSKNWPREGGGKFVTIYPSGDEQFRRLAASLSAATEGLDGPYVLSDRRVPGPSRIVHYRYGEHAAASTVSPQGHRVPVIAAPTGETASDRRKGYYDLPSWVDDPYGARPVQVIDRDERVVTLGGRYEVLGAIKYSNMGGMYVGRDVQTEREVVIRERRPGVGWMHRRWDAVALLHREARILERMAGTGWMPEPLAVLQAWEHHYLVMERVQGVLLRDYANMLFHRRKNVGSPRKMAAELVHVIGELVRGVEEFHARGIVIRDLTVGNVLVRPDRTLCFIDFEYAWQRDVDREFMPRIATPGFASPDQEAGAAPTEADDFYSLGAIVVELSAMLAPGLGLSPRGTLALAEMAVDEVGLPRELLAIARGLLERDAAKRWKGDDVRRALAALPLASVPRRAAEPGRRNPPQRIVRPGVERESAEAARAVCRFLDAAATPQRDDQLWPGSPEAFRTNAVSVRYGACGPIELVRRVRGEAPAAWLDWVERRATADRLPAGLQLGRAGVALTLARAGRTDAAARLIHGAVAEDLLPAHADLYHGAAGVGVAALALERLLGDPSLGEAAARLGEGVERAAERRGGGLAWPAGDGSIPCGLAMGGSGVALFLTYLGARTGEERWWGVARQALEWEFRQVSPSSGFAFWPLSRRGRRKSYRSPHVQFGSAGVATAAIRLWKCTGEPELLAWALRAADALTLRWTNKLWQDMGFAGWGETLLDMHVATCDETWRGHALRVAEALLATRMETRFGTAFPGGGLSRVSCDFGNGAAGIAAFLHRLAHAGAGRAFYPDALLPGWADAEPLSAPPAAEAASPPSAGTSGEAAARRPAGRAPGRARARTPA